MKCPTCESEGRTSYVYPGGMTVTAMYCPSFYDEDGRYHNHDSNISTARYSCSNGHAWTVSTTGSCWCGWPDRKDAPTPPPAFDPDGIVATTAGQGIVIGNGTGCESGSARREA